VHWQELAKTNGNFDFTFKFKDIIVQDLH